MAPSSTQIDGERGNLLVRASRSDFSRVSGRDPDSHEARAGQAARRYRREAALLKNDVHLTK
jgi:hypothetical protein